MRPHPSSKTGYIPTLDGWRAIAVSLVLFNHATLTGLARNLDPAQEYGTLGVDLFFAISGLLICSRLLEEERVNGVISLRGFYIRRSFRIFPAAFLYLGVIALLGLLSILPTDWAAWLSALVFLRNYFTAFVRETYANRFTGHFWSLAIEEHFYLLLPSLLVFFPRHRKLVLAALTALALLWLGLYIHITPPDLRSIFWERRTDLRIASLLFPALLALFLAEPTSRARIARWVRPATFYLLAFAAIAAWLLKRHLYPHPHLPPPPISLAKEIYSVAPGGPAHPFQQFVVPFLFPLLVIATILHPRTLAGRLLESKPLRSLGRISYSVYLWQQLFWVSPYRHWPIARVQQPLVGIILVFAASLASYFLVEKPLIRLGHRLAPPSTPGHRDLNPTT